MKMCKFIHPFDKAVYVAPIIEYRSYGVSVHIFDTLFGIEWKNIIEIYEAI